MRALALSVLAAGLLFTGCGEDEGAGGDPPAVARTGGSRGSARGGAGGAAASGGTGGSVTGTGGATGSGGAATGAGGSGGTGGTDGAAATDGGVGDKSAPGDGAASDTAASEGGSAPLPGLTTIFNGMNLDGWEGPASVWSVANGVLTGGGQRGQLTTRATYANFRLVISLRLASGDDHLGLCLWGTKRVFDCLLVIPPSGAIYDYVTNRTERMIQYDPEAKRTWHTTEILANKQTGVVKVAVDGKARPDYMDGLVARRPAGPIGLQLHSGGIKVEFKDISVEVDPKEDRLITLKP